MSCVHFLSFFAILSLFPLSFLFSLFPNNVGRLVANSTNMYADVSHYYDFILFHVCSMSDHIPASFNCTAASPVEPIIPVKSLLTGEPTSAATTTALHANSWRLLFHPTTATMVTMATTMLTVANAVEGLW